MPFEGKRFWQALLIAAILGAAAIQLHAQGRLWICACGRIDFWSGNIWSSDNSQHILDPYSFTHILHGLAFFWLLHWLLPKLPLGWRLCIAIAIESAWEIVENAPFIISRYREVTLALGYEGDTVVNSISDIVLCGVGFLLVQQLGIKRSVIFFVVVELTLMLWIRDGLVLNIVMLIYPFETIKMWQIGG